MKALLAERFAALFPDSVVRFARLIHLDSLIASLVYGLGVLAVLYCVIYVLEARSGEDRARYRSRNSLNDVFYLLFYQGGLYNVLIGPPSPMRSARGWRFSSGISCPACRPRRTGCSTGWRSISSTIGSIACGTAYRGCGHSTPFITPNNFHHSADPKHRDVNFGKLLSTWDFLFGTGVDRDPRPVTTGVAGLHVPASLTQQFILPFRLLFGRSGQARATPEWTAPVHKSQVSEPQLVEKL